MSTFDTTLSAPLALGEDGTIRIRGSRVTLDSVVHQFQDGAVAEQIQESFPSLSLGDVYGAITYYLEHEHEVEEYLQKQAAPTEAVWKKIDSRQDLTALRKRVRERRNVE